MRGRPSQAVFHGTAPPNPSSRRKAEIHLQYQKLGEARPQPEKGRKVKSAWSVGQPVPCIADTALRPERRDVAAEVMGQLVEASEAERKLPIRPAQSWKSREGKALGKSARAVAKLHLRSRS